MNELLRRWAELEPGALTYAPGVGERADQLQIVGAQGGGKVWVSPDWPDDPEGQGVLLHALWEVIEGRGWRWVMLFAPAGDATPPYLARVTAHPAGEGQTRRGPTPAQALLAGYVAMLEVRSGKVSSLGEGP